VSKDEIDFVIGAQIGQPVPAEDTFDADNDIFDKGKHQFKIAFRIGFDVQVDDHFALTVQDADINKSLPLQVKGGNPSSCFLFENGSI
jgi:hypothetical protein